MHRLINRHNYSFVPHSAQNLVPGSFSAPQLGQAVFMPMGAPHSGQNLAPNAISAPQLRHFCRPRGAPQFLQNLPLPAGRPHFGHVVVRPLIFPDHTVVFSAASSMFLRIACE